MNLDFSSPNFTAFRSVHKNTFKIISICNLQFSFAFFDSISIATSSINLDILMFAYLFTIFFENNNRVYIENKMSEIDNLYGISVRITRAACFFFHRMLIRSFDKS